MAQLLLLLLSCVASAVPSALGAQGTGTSAGGEAVVSGEDFWIIGGSLLSTAAMAPADRYLARQLEDPDVRRQHLLPSLADRVSFAGRPR